MHRAVESRSAFLSLVLWCGTMQSFHYRVSVSWLLWGRHQTPFFKCCWHVHSTWLSSRTHDEHAVFPGWISCAPKLGEETKSGPSLFPEFLRVSCLNCLKKGYPIPWLPWFGRSFPPRSARTVRIRCQRRCTWGITSWGQTPASIAA